MAISERSGRVISVRMLVSPGGLRGRRLVVTVVVLALVVVFAWPEWNSTSVAPTTTMPAVSGVVVEEGGPLPLPGQSDIRPMRSMPLLVRGTTTSGVHVLRHLVTDGHGRFALKLPPGIYTITAEIYTSNPTGFEPHAKVTVIRGQPVHVRITDQVI